jgi:hypothetical protein
VCPEDRDFRDQNNWKTAASHPQLLSQSGAEALDRDGGASRFWKSAVARERVSQALSAAHVQGGPQRRRWLWLLAVVIPLLAIVLLNHRQEQSLPEPQRANAPTNALEQAAPLFLPARLPRGEAQSLRSSAAIMVVGVQQQIVLPADGKSLKAEARFSYDPKLRELRPINEAARHFLDLRRGVSK